MNDFGMFTDLGNRVVKNIIDNAIERKQSWKEVMDSLIDLGENELNGNKRFEEATDTVVRGNVFDALVQANIIDEDEPFYI